MPKCSVPKCKSDADYEVILYDVYFPNGELFFEQDTTCPFICAAHALENEQRAVGERKPRGIVEYPFTNRRVAQGFTIYKPLSGDARGQQGSDVVTTEGAGDW